MYNVKTNFLKLPRGLFKLNLKPNEFIVLSYLLLLSGRDFIHPSRKTIAKNCGLKSISTVNRTIKSLVQRGLISYVKGCTGYSNSYILNIPGVIRTEAEGKYAPSMTEVEKYKVYTEQDRENKQFIHLVNEQYNNQRKKEV